MQRLQAALFDAARPGNDCVMGLPGCRDGDRRQPQGRWLKREQIEAYVSQPRATIREFRDET